LVLGGIPPKNALQMAVLRLNSNTTLHFANVSCDCYWVWTEPKNNLKQLRLNYRACHQNIVKRIAWETGRRFIIRCIGTTRCQWQKLMTYVLGRGIPLWMLHTEPSRLADDSAFSLGTRIFDKLAGRTLPRDLDWAWQAAEQNNHQLANERRVLRNLLHSPILP